MKVRTKLGLSDPATDFGPPVTLLNGFPEGAPKWAPRNLIKDRERLTKQQRETVGHRSQSLPPKR